MSLLKRRSTFDLFYSEHHAWLFGWVRRKLGCRSSAEDLAQDTFLRLLQRGGVEDVLQPRALLATIARRLIIDESRRQDIERAYLDAYAALHASGCAPSSESVAAAVQALTALSLAIDRLPGQAGQAFLMSVFDGMLHKDIALALEVSEATVRRHIALALLACRDAFVQAGWNPAP